MHELLQKVQQLRLPVGDFDFDVDELLKAQGLWHSD
jgi:hypothetical protein